MENETEAILIALADPITWICYTNNNGQEHWQGNSKQFRFAISPPRYPRNVDFQPHLRWWRLYVTRSEEDFGTALSTPIESIDDAKALALRCIQSEDRMEVTARKDVAYLQGQVFHNNRRTAHARITQHFHKRKTPRLPFPGRSNTALEFHTTVAQGTYHVHFEPERRWVVRFTDHRHKTEEHCFVTRNLTKRACFLHTQTGQWHGTLQESIGK